MNATENEQRIRRVNVAVGPETLAAIDRVIQREQVTLTEAVRRLISYGEFAYRTVKVEHHELLVRRGDQVWAVELI